MALTERRRQARAAQKDGEQQRLAAQKDAELRDQQHPVVVGSEDLEDGPSDSDRVRGCLRRLPDRAPAGQPQLVVEWFATMMIAVGEMGYFGNLYGRKANIAATLSRILGTPVCPRMLGQALTILHGMKCCLVDLAEKKKWWTVKLSGLGDPTSALHQAFLAETGTGFQLPPEKVSYPGGRPVRPEIPGKSASGEVTPPGTSTTADTLAQPSRAPAREGAEPDPSPAVGPRDAAPATDPAARVGEADLRHRLTVAQGLVKLARQRHEEDRGVWHRARAELERRVAAAEKREQATVAELALLRGQHDALLAKVTAIEQTAERTIAALVDKLERATSALEAAAEHQEVERQQRAAEADRHASEVAGLTRQAEELRQREHDVAAGRDQHAAEAERLGRVADEQRRREHDLIAGRDRDVGQQVDLRAAAEGVVRRTEECDLSAPRIADQHRPAAVAGETGPGLSNVSSIVVACVGWTVATLTFTAARRVSTRSSPTHGAAALTSGMGESGGCGLRQTPARFPWGGPAPSTGDLAAQGPRGPPVRRG